jgi:hypothetical protein
VPETERLLATLRDERHIPSDLVVQIPPHLVVAL